MRKYFAIYSVLLKNAFSRDAHYRADTITHWLTHLVWLGMLYILIDVLFRFTNSIAGWSKPEVFLLMNMFILSQQIFLFLFRENIWEIPNIITDGKLDKFLVMPANTIFMLTCRQISLRATGRILTQLVVLGWLLSHYHVIPSLGDGLILVVLLILGIAIQVAHGLIMNTLSFWFLRIDNINEAWFNIGQIGKYPLSVLPQTLRVLTYTLVPIAYQNFIPVGVGVGKLGFNFVSLVALYGLILWFIAIRFWHFGLRRYASASS